MPAESGRGVFVTVEGGDGAGKTTLARKLAEHLQASGRSVRLTFEPGGTALGTRLRGLVLDPRLTMSDWDETWLFLAARASHVNDILRPALDVGEFVLSDRYTDSTLAYQGYGRGLDLQRLIALNREATQGLTPDLTVLLDIPAEVGLARTRARSAEQDRIGDADIAFHRRVNAGFRELARQDSQRIHVVDATRDADSVFAEALEVVNNRLVTRRTRS